jgi:hypothetical protein
MKRWMSYRSSGGRTARHGAKGASAVKDEKAGEEQRENI